MYYYPYYLHLCNLFSFTHHNDLKEEDDATSSSPTIDLWSIRRHQGGKHPLKSYTASYHHYTKNYEFAGKRYVSYDDLVKDAMQL